ncbi:MAG: T9SS type A sorting domain-containing protein [Chitinophagales bacterium]|nr:T9SS type A sorting domain-containing protein [Chitinophagales bacterium]
MTFRHYHRKWRIWRNKFGFNKLVKKITPLMLAVLMSKNVDGQELRLYERDNVSEDSRTNRHVNYSLYKPTFTDLDGDGDFDVFVLYNTYPYEYGTTCIYFENKGNREFPNLQIINFHETDSILIKSNLVKISGFGTYDMGANNDYSRYREFLDIDGDEDFDLIDQITEVIYEPNYKMSPYTYIYENMGNKMTPLFDTIPMFKFSGYFSILDINSDGNFDLYNLSHIDDYYVIDTCLVYHLNKGSFIIPEFDFLMPDTVELIDYNKDIIDLKLADMDGDGIDDLVIFSKEKPYLDPRYGEYLYYHIYGTYFKRNNNEVLEFENGGEAFFDSELVMEGHYGWVEILQQDIDYDGDFDIHIGGIHPSQSHFTYFNCGLFFNTGMLLNSIEGNVDIDLDGDGIFTQDENYNHREITKFDYYGEPYTETIYFHKLTNHPIVAEGVDYIFPIDEMGEFTVFTSDGTQKIYPKPVPNFEFEPPFYTYDFPADTNISVANVQFVMKPITGRYDVAVDFSGLATRPGFETKQYLYYKNLAGNPTNGTLSYTPPAELTILSTQPNFDRTESGVYYWDIEDLQALESEQVEVNLQVDVNAVLNTPIQSVVSFELTNGTDFNPLNNTDTLFGRITGSFDPNDKLVSPSGLDGGLTAVTDRSFEYTIRFQNMGNDTAFTVIITDTLDTDFNLSSFEMVCSSHNYELSVRNNNVLIWKFRNILLPPSNTNLTGSQGFVKYRFTPKEDADIGTIFTNKADIYFDYNTPVVTNETRNIFGVISGIHNHQHQQDIVSKAYPNPTKNKLLIEFNNAEKQDVIITIYDIEGQQILQKTIREGFFSFDVHNLSAGTYLYTIESVSAFGKGKFIKE